MIHYSESTPVYYPFYEDETKMVLGDDIVKHKIPIVSEKALIKYIIDFKRYVGTINGNDTTFIIFDTLHIDSFQVIIQKNAPLPDSSYLNTWSRTLKPYYNGSAITAATSDMKEIEFRFEKYPVTVAEYNYGNALLNIKSCILKDSETIKLDSSGEIFKNKIPIINSGNAKPGDTILQLAQYDSVIAIFRNMRLPLDTLRISIPFTGNSAIHDAAGLDNSLPFYYKKGDCIVFNSLDRDSYVEIYSIRGEKIVLLRNTEKPLKYSRLSLNVKAFPRGIYVFVCHNDKNKIPIKIILD